MGDLDALAGAGKQHRVVTDDVATSDGGETNARGVTLTGMPSRAYTAQSFNSRPKAWATTSPILRAVPEGASTLWRWWASMISMS